MAVSLSNIFVNLPVKDLQRSMNFFQSIGFEFNPQFSDEKAACLVIGPNIFTMLLTEEYFKSFTKKEIPDTTGQSEVIVALSAESRDQVDEIVNKALASGGKPYSDPVDHGFMYTWSFQDPDSHLWEIVFMDSSAVPSE